MSFRWKIVSTSSVVIFSAANFTNWREFVADKKPGFVSDAIYCTNAVMISLQPIPFVAVEILEDNHRAMGFVTRILEKADSVRLHRLVLRLEVVGVEKEEEAAPGLVSGAGVLIG
jgi:hypothetical protein